MACNVAPAHAQHHAARRIPLLGLTRNQLQEKTCQANLGTHGGHHLQRHVLAANLTAAGQQDQL
ncbi:MAG: hypothetical protein ACK55I_05165, partial [bacterium]